MRLKAFDEEAVQSEGIDRVAKLLSGLKESGEVLVWHLLRQTHTHTQVACIICTRDTRSQLQNCAPDTIHYSGRRRAKTGQYSVLTASSYRRSR